jgi:hypothetical protein
VPKNPALDTALTVKLIQIDKDNHINGTSQLSTMLIVRINELSLIRSKNGKANNSHITITLPNIREVGSPLGSPKLFSNLIKPS